MLDVSEGSPEAQLSEMKTLELVDEVLERLGGARALRRVLLLPPDYTRFHSGAGMITCHLDQRLAGAADVTILPATGTHFPMADEERAVMFPGIPASRFRDHDWRNGVVRLGTVPAEVMEEISGGLLRIPAEVEVDRLLVEQPWDTIISVGQLVPHEVIGIANHIKNVLVGAGGSDLINKSHWLGAVYGMERVMGRVSTPVRRLLNWAADHFLAHLPITYLLTVRGTEPDGRLVTRGLFAGQGTSCFERGAELCRAVNLDILDRAPSKVVVWLDPHEYKSTWLGNKAIYRTRMAIADDGELIVLAPGVKQFGEDPTIDRLIRRFGYYGTADTIARVAENPELAENLSAAAHLIHGSSEGRFRVRYAPGHMSREEIESVGYEYGDLDELMTRYAPTSLQPGFNRVGDEEVFFVANPALGLWGTADRFA